MVASVGVVPGGRVVDVVDVLDGVTGRGITRVVIVGCVNVVVVVEGTCDVGGVVTVVVVASVVDTVTVGLVDGTDGSLLFVVVVIVVGGTVESVVDVESSVVVLPKLVVVDLGMVVDTDVLDEGMMVVVSDGTSVVDTEIVVVGQCW